MIIETISITPKAISTFMTLEKIIGGQGQCHFMDLVRLEKASNVSRDLFLITIIHKITEAESVKNILVKTSYSIYAQQYARKWKTFQDGGHFQHEKHFVDSFLQTCAILMTLVSNHTVFTMQNLNFHLRNSVKA